MDVSAMTQHVQSSATFNAIQPGTQISSGMICCLCLNSLTSNRITSFGDLHGSLNHVSVFRRHDNVSSSCTIGNVNYNSGVIWLFRSFSTYFSFVNRAWCTTTEFSKSEIQQSSEKRGRKKRYTCYLYFITTVGWRHIVFCRLCPVKAIKDN